ncbi:DUF2860 family protein [Vibrio lentus]|nr:DUF2860 family protein [Vibrio lentus]
MMLASPSYAQLGTKRRFQGNIDLPNWLLPQPSNLDVGQSNQSQTILMSSGVTEANGMVAILGSMQYTFGALNHKQIFLGTSRDDIITGTLAFEVGYRQQLESGMVIDFSIY